MNPEWLTGRLCAGHGGALQLFQQLRRFLFGLARFDFGLFQLGIF